MSEERDRRDPDNRGYRPRRGHAAKDTRRWCKGVVGREHVLAPGLPNWVKGSLFTKCRLEPDSGEGFPWCRLEDYPDWICYHHTMCTECGKVLVRQVKDCPDRPRTADD